jgi:hypothetical protein
MIVLCDECAPDGCEELTIGILAPKTCELCKRADCARRAFDLQILKEEWFNDGYSCGANNASGSYE